MAAKVTPNKKGRTIMKKCKNCGALQSDDKTTCLDCGTLLGKPMNEKEEEAAEQLIDNQLEDMVERTEDFYVPLHDKIMGILGIVCIIAAVVLIAISSRTLDEIRETLPKDTGGISVTYYSTDNGYTTVHSEGREGYSSQYSRIDELEQAAAWGIGSIFALLAACPLLLLPRLMWNLSTFKYRFFHDWDTTPSDTALVIRKIAAYVLFGVGMIALGLGWLCYF